MGDLVILPLQTDAGPGAFKAWAVERILVQLHGFEVTIHPGQEVQVALAPFWCSPEARGYERDVLTMGWLRLLEDWHDGRIGDDRKRVGSKRVPGRFFVMVRCPVLGVEWFACSACGVSASKVKMVPVISQEAGEMLYARWMGSRARRAR